MTDLEKELFEALQKIISAFDDGWVEKANSKFSDEEVGIDAAKSVIAKARAVI